VSVVPQDLQVILGIWINPHLGHFMPITHPPHYSTGHMGTIPDDKNLLAEGEPLTPQRSAPGYPKVPS